MTFLLPLALVLIFLICGHAIYIPVLRILGNRWDRKELEASSSSNIVSNTENRSMPTISVVIPVYNEASVIERRIQNILENNYQGKLEIIVVDSGSDDETSSLIQSKFSSVVSLIQEPERRGKAHAINLALKNCKGEIIILTDGPALFEKNTLFELAKLFQQDSSIGAASAIYRVPNDKQNITTTSEGVMWTYKNRLRILESRAQSTSWLSGEACAFRKNILQEVSEDTLADDSNIAFQVISRGLRAVVTDKTAFSERSPSGHTDYLKVKVRRALGGLQEILRFKFFLFNSRYGNFGLFIFPYRLFLELVSPVLFALAVALVVPSIIDLYIHLGTGAMVVIIILVVSIFIMRRKVVTAYLYLQLVSILAIISLLLGKKDVKWTRSTTTR